jgi:hypothetical protein
VKREKKKAVGAKKPQKVIHAWCELASGPGWQNSIVWVLLRDTDGRLSLDGLQPREYGEVLRVMHAAADVANRTLCSLTRKSVLSAWPAGFCRLECVMPGPRGGYITKIQVIDPIDNAVVTSLAGVVRAVTSFARSDWKRLRNGGAL